LPRTNRSEDRPRLEPGAGPRLSQSEPSGMASGTELLEPAFLSPEVKRRLDRAGLAAGAVEIQPLLESLGAHSGRGPPHLKFAERSTRSNVGFQVFRLSHQDDRMRPHGGPVAEDVCEQLGRRLDFWGPREPRRPPHPPPGKSSSRTCAGPGTAASRGSAEVDGSCPAPRSPAAPPTAGRSDLAASPRPAFLGRSSCRDDPEPGLAKKLRGERSRLPARFEFGRGCRRRSRAGGCSVVPGSQPKSGHRHSSRSAMGVFSGRHDQPGLDPLLGRKRRPFGSLIAICARRAQA